MLQLKNKDWDVFMFSFIFKNLQYKIFFLVSGQVQFAKFTDVVFHQNIGDYLYFMLGGVIFFCLDHKLSEYKTIWASYLMQGIHWIGQELLSFIKQFFSGSSDWSIG